MPTTPKDKVHKVFEGYLVTGLARDENAEQSGVSGGNVSGLAKELEDLIGPVAANYSRSRAVARRKAHLLPEDDDHGAELVQMAREKGIPWETARKQFKGLIDMSSTPRLAATTPEQLANAVADTIDVAIAKGIQISEVAALEQQKIERIKSLDVEIDKRNESCDKAMLRQKTILTEAGMTLGMVSEYQENKKFFGITGMADRKKAAKVIERMHGEYGWDYDRMVADFSTNETLRQKNKRQQVMIASNDKRLEDQATADEYHRLVEAVPDDLKHMTVSRFNRLSVQEGMTPQLCWSKCLYDIIYSYTDLLAMARRVQQMASVHDDLVGKVRIKKAQLSYLDNQYKNAEASLGEANNELEEVTNMVKQCREDIAMLDKEFKMKKVRNITLDPLPAESKYLDDTVKESGTLHFGSGHATTPYSGDMTSGFASEMPPT